MQIEDQRLLIDGELVTARSGRSYDNLNPATEEVIGAAPDAGTSDLERAVLAARRAFDESDWSTNHALRRECVLALQGRLRKDVERIRWAHTAETGMPLSLAHAIGVDGPIENLSYYADRIDTVEWDRQLPSKVIFQVPSARVIRKEASGVVAAITPWNYPVQLNLTKIGAALAAGCTVILKPAPETPWSGTLLAEAAAESGFPPGVLNVVTTSDNSVAELLTTHPAVDHVTFTGSTATGRRIAANAAGTIKRLSLELGGKSAAVVLDDADLATAIPQVAGGICMHAGQGCALQTRLLVPHAVMDQAAEIAAATVSHIPYGDPFDLNTMMGPLINERQFRRVLDYIELGKIEGRLITGGGRAEQFERGWFVQPTVIADVPNKARVAQEEIFGPVLVIVGFDDDQDAVRTANDSPYGLSGAVFSADQDRAVAVAKRIRTGTISVNGSQWFDPDSPFGGYKQSGLGREWGPEGFEDFLETKTMSIPG
jgi:aldehyde dehydrogenase (NAD+)